MGLKRYGVLRGRVVTSRREDDLDTPAGRDMRDVMVAAVAGVVGVFAAGAAGAASELVTFQGICDASAALALDADHIVVGDDEQPYLSVYRLDGGERLDRIELPHLGREDEADIEGATILADRIVWISSNGRNGDGKVEKSRFQLFASHRLDARHHWKTDVSPSFDRLPEAIRAMADPEYKPLRKAVGDLDRKDEDLAPKKRGFNIEGLTVSRAGDALLVGVRNPHPHGEAILFAIDNARALLDGAADEAELGTIVHLPLGDRGIRDIAWSPAHQAYLIAAGQTDDEDEPGPGFALFRWDGSGSPQEIESFRRILEAHPDFHPEAVTPLLEMSGGEMAPSRRVLVISDDGTRKVAGDACKKAEKRLRSFRAVVLTID